MSQSNLKERMRHKIDTFSDVLYQEYWTAKDLQGDFEDRQSVVLHLKNAGVITVVGRTRFGESCKWDFDHPAQKKEIQVYTWIDDIQGYLQDYLENRDELPCDCRAHIPAETDENGKYICKFCGSKHSRDVIQSAL